MQLEELQLKEKEASTCDLVQMRRNVEKLTRALDAGDSVTSIWY
ncbi:hypothetical protein PC129_g22390 [Phytophthora cactorum]|uniref:Uncharacterized protein n=1 Tax=Phytophthora cactorum TaxID=29920 RepID=A0A329RCZ8_9STRA|nr:hypothetical protein PC111_g22571 [Phytophthora cactorum]KAG2794834.1 hypothetical protein PC112_g22883 [Phytophthora cactorum]KAG2823221.1 hypothetical protein PC113_g22217 [Phytophthora cactorum]KAG2873403.1 hypothetical protein PC114_g25870 [Phytophthora cactorum]KAG2886960.1 hypothetical protein PC117_g25274 [Phytophthora cactorum]